MNVKAFGQLPLFFGVLYLHVALIHMQYGPSEVGTFDIGLTKSRDIRIRDDRA